MNDYIELMERTLSEWVKEYPIEWIELAYKNTVGEPTTKNDLGVDCIDRAELLKAMDTWDKFGYSARYGLERLDKDDKGFVAYVKYDDMVNCVKGMPSVIPYMPSVTPQEPKTGHWIDTDEWRETVDGFEQWGYFRKCSKCGYVFKFLEIDNYCPNCGAKMVEAQESEE